LDIKQQIQQAHANVLGICAALRHDIEICANAITSHGRPLSYAATFDQLERDFRYDVVNRIYEKHTAFGHQVSYAQVQEALQEFMSDCKRPALAEPLLAFTKAMGHFIPDFKNGKKRLRADLYEGDESYEGTYFNIPVNDYYKGFVKDGPLLHLHEVGDLALPDFKCLPNDLTWPIVKDYLVDKNPNLKKKLDWNYADLKGQEPNPFACCGDGIPNTIEAANDHLKRLVLKMTAYGAFGWDENKGKRRIRLEEITHSVKTQRAALRMYTTIYFFDILQRMYVNLLCKALWQYMCKEYHNEKNRKRLLGQAAQVANAQGAQSVAQARRVVIRRNDQQRTIEREINTTVSRIAQAAKENTYSDERAYCEQARFLAKMEQSGIKDVDLNKDAFSVLEGVASQSPTKNRARVSVVKNAPKPNLSPLDRAEKRAKRDAQRADKAKLAKDRRARIAAFRDRAEQCGHDVRSLAVTSQDPKARRAQVVTSRHVAQYGLGFNVDAPKQRASDPSFASLGRARAQVACEVAACLRESEENTAIRSKLRWRGSGPP